MIRYRKYLSLLSVLFFTSVLTAAQAASAPAVCRPASSTVAPGVNYQQLCQTSPDGLPWSIHVLKMDRNNKQLDLRAAPGVDAAGRMDRVGPSQIARAVPRAVAVVNGDYDAPPTMGVSIGLSVTSGRLWTSARDGWPVMALRDNGEPLIGNVDQKIELRSGKRRWPVAAMNKPLDKNASLRAYTRDFREKLTSERPLTAVVVERLQPALPLGLNGRIRGVVSGVSKGTEVAIPENALVLVSGGDELSGLRAGNKIELRTQYAVEGRSDLREVIGGFPVLARAGRKQIEGEPAESLRKRHPRTATCYSQREFILTVVDGRQPQLSVGMTLDELADLMVSLGCEVAMNTDGGGSSVMAIEAEGGALRIVNSPSDGKERGRGNAWVVVKK